MGLDGKATPASEHLEKAHSPSQGLSKGNSLMSGIISDGHLGVEKAQRKRARWMDNSQQISGRRTLFFGKSEGGQSVRRRLILTLALILGQKLFLRGSDPRSAA